ncbi:MAG TPA: DciA family protein [Allosphingosinicella sp.]
MLGPMAKSGGKTKKQEEAPRSNRARAVSDMLPHVGGAAFRRFGFVQSSIVSRWREIVGERYATVSSPESIRFPPGKRSDGVLTLVVEGAHGPMMQHVAPLIVERVNRFFGYAAVQRVSIRQGLVQLARAKARTAPPSLRPIPADLGESLRTIADPELRACLESLAGAVAEANEAKTAPTVTLAIPVIGRIGERKK